MTKNRAQAHRRVRGDRDVLLAHVAARPTPAARSKAVGRPARDIPAKRKSWTSSTDAEASAGRIVELEKQLAHAPANSRQRRDVMKAIRIEATVYRKSLDAEQTLASHGSKS